MSATLTLTDAQVSIIARALFRELEHVSKGRATAEKRLADPGTLTHVDWVGAALREERALAAIDDLVGKLPPWVAHFMAQMCAERTAA
jgi:hypothetical protein